MSKKYEMRKGTCNICGKKNVVNVNVYDRLGSLWVCWKCAAKEFGINPPEKKFCSTIGEMIKTNSKQLES